MFYNINISLLYTFLMSIFGCILLIILCNKKRIGIDRINGVQKLHKNKIARTGGIAIVIAFVFGLTSYFRLPEEIKMIKCIIIALLPITVSGFIEDITGKVQPFFRLILSFSSAALFYFLLEVVIQRSSIVFFDELLQIEPFGFILTMLAIAAVLNGTNIIDGLNGLLAIYAIVVLSILGIVLFQLGNQLLFKITLFCILSILGFVFFVFPFSRLFLGDGGAYFIGTMISFLVIVTVNTYQQISPWFALLMIIYPFFELQVSIVRRFIKKQSPLEPDQHHLHSLLFQYCVKNIRLKNKIANPISSILIISVLILFLSPAIWYWNHSKILIGLIIAFCITYLISYYYLNYQLQSST